MLGARARRSPLRSTRSGSRPIGQNPGVAISYDVVGAARASGASERRGRPSGERAALTDEQMTSVESGRPDGAGHRRIVVPLQSARPDGPLKLGREVYVDILPEYPDLDAPRLRAQTRPQPAHRNIAIVARQDSSGTTVASQHLSAVSRPARSGTGVGNLSTGAGPPCWHVAQGVAGSIKVSESSIGYVEYHFAKRLGLSMAQVQNKAGRYVAPGEQGGQAALAANVKQMPRNLASSFPTRSEESTRSSPSAGCCSTRAIEPGEALRA